MDKEEFNRKWKELKEKSRLQAKYKDIGIISKMSFKDIVEVIYISFDVTSTEQDQEGYREQVLKVSNLIKQFNISGEADYDGVFGAFEYNAVFLTEIRVRGF